MINVKEKHTVRKWSEFVQLVGSRFQGRWHFRGVLDTWSLETTLERAAHDWKLDPEELPAIETRLLAEFKRTCPLQSNPSLPEADATLEWLALMQHHGAPTRLLDWTYSPFVAAFFALDALLRCSDKKRLAALWALSSKAIEKPENSLSTPALKQEYNEYQKTRGGRHFQAIFFDAVPPVNSAFLVNPYRLTERLTVQQGVFLCPGNIRIPFEQNLRALPDLLKSGNLQKILLPPSMLGEAFEAMHRMNINSATLFPGVDGYAQGLRHRIQFLRSSQIYHGTM